MNKIHIRNFQAIEDVSLTLDGFTTVVGKSNVGKSAIIRALKALLTNAQGVAMVRHKPTCERKTKGTKTCHCVASVHLVGDSYDILWEKGDNVSRYTVNGTVYESVPKGFPEFLAPWFRPIKIGTQQRLLQVSSQFDPPFLLDVPGSNVADVLTGVAKLDSINEAARLAEKDRKAAQATLRVREKDRKRLQQEKAQYQGVVSIEKDATELEIRAGALGATELSLKHMREQQARYVRLGEGVKTLQGITKVRIPTEDHLVKTQVEVQAQRSFLASLDTLRTNLSGLTRVVSVEPPASSSVEAKAETYQKGLVFLRSYQALQAQLRRLESVCAVGDVSFSLTSKDTYDFLTGVVGQLRAIKRVYGPLSKVVKEPLRDMPDWKGRREQLDRLSRYVSRMDQVRKNIEEMERDLLGLQRDLAEIESALGEYKTCPVCGSPLVVGKHTNDVKEKSS